VQDSPQNAASSSTTERPIPLTAMYPKMYVRRQCEQRNAGEQDYSRSTAAVHKAVSGILTPATDSTRAKVIAFPFRKAWNRRQERLSTRTIPQAAGSFLR
jgi:hypothetical protein